jgi:hypothetical protein
VSSGHAWAASSAEAARRRENNVHVAPPRDPERQRTKRPRNHAGGAFHRCRTASVLGRLPPGLKPRLWDGFPAGSDGPADMRNRHVARWSVALLAGGVMGGSRPNVHSKSRLARRIRPYALTGSICFATGPGCSQCTFWDALRGHSASVGPRPEPSFCDAGAGRDVDNPRATRRRTWTRRGRGSLARPRVGHGREPASG